MADFGGEMMPAVGYGPAEVFASVGERWRLSAPRLDPVFESDLDRSLHIAWLVPPWGIGSGGHMALFRLASLLEERGHSSSIWMVDSAKQFPYDMAVARRQVIEHFAPLECGVYPGLKDWHGADVAIATGWQTAHPLWSLDRVKLKTYLVQDYEPEFYPQSSERLWARETYELGYPCVCSSPWLSALLQERHGARAEHFDYAADAEVYRDFGAQRDPDTVVFYARQATPRRGTELGILALGELVERRPSTKVVVFGDVNEVAMPFEYEFLGVRPPVDLADLYNRAAAGLVISLTNYSLIPKEMMACGLPVVDVIGSSAASVFGESEVIALTEPNPTAIAERIQGLLDDPESCRQIADAAKRYVSEFSWEQAAGQVEAHIRKFMGERVAADRLAAST